MMSILFHQNIKEFASSFDGFIIDLWGVLHDGTAPYPKALDALRYLREHNKKIILLSNAPRRAHKAIDVLNQLSFSEELYDHVYTSGEATYEYLQSNISNYASKYFMYIGPHKDEDILEGLDYSITNNAKEASFALATGFDAPGQTFDTKQAQIDAALAAELPLICANPDKLVVKQSGEKWLCAGLIAEYYEVNGGEVVSFGKPHTSVYERCLKLFHDMEIDDKQKICAIGDSFETDVKGANNMNIFSVFIAGGILAEPLNILPGDMPSQQAVDNLVKKYGIEPNVILPIFSY